jgi:hypothetical protein
MADRELKGKVEKAIEFGDSVVPAHLKPIEFDRRRGIAVELGPIRWTAIPAVGALGDKGATIDVRNVVRNPSTWLLLRRDSLNTLAGLELEVKEAREKGKVDVRVFRSSGRSVAEGTAWDSDRGVEFEVRVIGVRVPRRKQQGTVLRGVLDTSGRLRMTLG